MVAKKEAKTKKATGTDVVKWEEELAADASQQSAASTQTGGGQTFSFAKGKISFQGEEIEGDSVDVVVLDFVYANTFYEGKYDPKNKTSPVCYAYARKEEDLAPFGKSEKPQNPDCASCEHNEFGSADTGRGKACKNTIRLAVIPADALESDISLAEVAYMIIPPTSKKNWDKFYKRHCQNTKEPKLSRPTYFYTTRVTVTPDDDAQFIVSFGVEESLSDREKYRELKAKVVELGDEIMAEFPKNSERKGKVISKKPGGKKKYHA